MRATVEPRPVDTPDAGVIEEARARQRRHRGVIAATTLAVAAVVAAVLGFASGGGGSRPGSASLRAGNLPLKSARPPAVSCASGQGRALQGEPSKSLLSILGVLRRPATAADALPRALAAQGAGSDAFVHYIRRARVVHGSPYYIYPVILGGCGGPVHQGISHLDANVDLGAGTIGATGGGGATAADIEQGRAVATGPPGSSTSATVTMIVPDGVASVTLHYPAGRASGYSPKISPPFTVTTAPVNNLVVVSVPRSGGGGPIRAPTMIWRAANGHIVKTFRRL